LAAISAASRHSCDVRTGVVHGDRIEQHRYTIINRRHSISRSSYRDCVVNSRERTATMTERSERQHVSRLAVLMLRRSFIDDLTEFRDGRRQFDDLTERCYQSTDSVTSAFNAMIST